MILLGAGSAALTFFGPRLAWGRVDLGPGPGFVGNSARGLGPWPWSGSGASGSRIATGRFAWPIGCLAISMAWLSPAWWGLALVYGHPLMALAVLDRELKRSRPAWRAGYRAALLAVPVLLVGLVVLLAATPSLPGDDPITRRIADHAGGRVTAGRFEPHAGGDPIRSSRCSTTVSGWWRSRWLRFARPRGAWKRSPMARGSRRWQSLLGTALLIGLGAVVLLWVAFLADYPTTRDVYFTVAVLHVLAEVPFLLRLL